jgi:hypothetical protein
MSPEGIYAHQFDPHGQEVDTRRYLEILHISFKYQCLHKRVDIFYTRNCISQKIVKKVFSHFIVQCTLYYAKLNFKLVYFITLFFSDRLFKTKTSFKGRKMHKYSFLNKNQCLQKQM